LLTIINYKQPSKVITAILHQVGHSFTVSVHLNCRMQTRIGKLQSLLCQTQGLLDLFSVGCGQRWFTQMILHYLE